MNSVKSTSPIQNIVIIVKENHSFDKFSYGSRVGCLVLSPYAKKGISKSFHSHVSLVKFCETTFGLPPLNSRDAASDGMADCFDFTQTPLPPPT